MSDTVVGEQWGRELWLCCCLYALASNLWKLHLRLVRINRECNYRWEAIGEIASPLLKAEWRDERTT